VINCVIFTIGTLAFIGAIYFSVDTWKTRRELLSGDRVMTTRTERPSEYVMRKGLDVYEQIDLQADRIKELEGWIAASDGLQCPSCDNTGGYPRQISEHEVVEEQCEFCWVVDDSVFNRNRKKLAAAEGESDD
jgi:hypothetical protein